MIDTGLDSSILDYRYYERFLEDKNISVTFFEKPKEIGCDINGGSFVGVGEIHNLRLHLRGGPKEMSFKESYFIAHIREVTGQDIIIGWDIFPKHFSIVSKKAFTCRKRLEPPEVVKGNALHTFPAAIIY